MGSKFLSQYWDYLQWCLTKWTFEIFPKFIWALFWFCQGNWTLLNPWKLVVNWFSFIWAPDEANSFDAHFRVLRGSLRNMKRNMITCYCLQRTAQGLRIWAASSVRSFCVNSWHRISTRKSCAASAKTAKICSVSSMICKSLCPWKSPTVSSTPIGINQSRLCCRCSSTSSLNKKKKSNPVFMDVILFVNSFHTLPSSFTSQKLFLFIYYHYFFFFFFVFCSKIIYPVRWWFPYGCSIPSGY